MFIQSLNMLVDLPLEEKKSFNNLDGTYFCNMCDNYTSDFSCSNIKNKDRRCRSCISLKRKNKLSQAGHIHRLKLKLYQNLIYQNQKRLVTDFYKKYTIRTQY